MSSLKITEAEKPAKSKSKEKLVMEKHIPASNCCTRWLYNIPQGTILLILPGVTILIIGAVLFVTNNHDSWRSGFFDLGMLLLIIGGVLTAGAVAFCGWGWCKQSPPPPQTTTRAHHEHEDPVQLVGVYRISNSDDLHMYTTSPEGVTVHTAIT